jgi:hypothetical protein
MFTLEQEEYEREGIPWKKIVYDKVWRWVGGRFVLIRFSLVWFVFVLFFKRRH